MYPMNWNSKLRRGMLLGLAAMAISGCASLKLPFGNKDLASQQKESKFAAAANAGTGFTGQFKSMGTAVSSAVGKAKTAVTNTFTTSSEAVDATSLATMPANLGPEIWVTNGHLYETQGNFAKAMDNYTKALETEPNNESALLSTARLYARQGQNDKAADFFNKAIAVSPQASSYNELALIHQKLGKMADAQVAISKAIEAEPSNARYRNNLASMLVASGRSDEAVKQLQQVFPPAVANYNVAYLHFTSSNIAAAQQHLQIALQADPNLQPARDLMDKLGGSQTAQTATAAYNTANQIYRTAQAAMGQPAPTQQAPYTTVTPPGGSQPTAQMQTTSAQSFVPSQSSMQPHPGMTMPAQPVMQAPMVPPAFAPGQHPSLPTGPTTPAVPSGYQMQSPAGSAISYPQTGYSTSGFATGS